jgi:predicted nucleic acid-binding protein
VRSVGVVLDTCVLYPRALRDTLLRAAEAGLYRACWSNDILEELRRNLAARPGIGDDRAARLLREMRRAFPEAAVTGYARLIGAMTNDPKDRHVVAAAVVAKAQIIVTLNRRDFPRAALTREIPEEAIAPFAIEVQDPDSFLMNLWGLDARVMAEIVIQQVADLGAPPVTPQEELDRIARQAPRFAAAVRAHLAATGRPDSGPAQP